MTLLKQSQLNKYQRIADQLDLQPGDNLLEIGLGWGGFAEFLAKNHPEVNYSESQSQESNSIMQDSD